MVHKLQLSEIWDLNSEVTLVENEESVVQSIAALNRCTDTRHGKQNKKTILRTLDLGY